MNEKTGWLTVPEAAALKGVSRQSIWAAIVEGRLAAWSVGKGLPYLIAPADLATYTPTRPTGGPPSPAKPRAGSGKKKRKAREGKSVQEGKQPERGSPTDPDPTTETGLINLQAGPADLPCCVGERSTAARR